MEGLLLGHQLYAAQPSLMNTRRQRGVSVAHLPVAPRAYLRRVRSPRDMRPVRGLVTIRQRFKRLTKIGLPRRFVIVQFPNVPLIVAFLAGELADHTHGSDHAYASAVSFLALAIWAYLELVTGVNWFRRLLGVAYMISTTVHLAMALH